MEPSPLLQEPDQALLENLTADNTEELPSRSAAGRIPVDALERAAPMAWDAVGDEHYLTGVALAVVFDSGADKASELGWPRRNLRSSRS